MGEPVKADVADDLLDPARLRLLAGDGERERDVLARSASGALKNWKTKPMCSRRSFVRSLSPSVVISVPATSTVPDVGLSRPARMCISVDFPDPEGPITAVKRERAMSTDTRGERRRRSRPPVAPRDVLGDDDRTTPFLPLPQAPLLE